MAATVVATILMADAPEDGVPAGVGVGADASATPEVGTPAATRRAVNVVALVPDEMLVTAWVMELDEAAAVVTVKATVMLFCSKWRPLPVAADTPVTLMAVAATLRVVASVLMNAVRTVPTNWVVVMLFSVMEKGSAVVAGGGEGGGGDAAGLTEPALDGGGEGGGDDAVVLGPQVLFVQLAVKVD